MKSVYLIRHCEAEGQAADARLTQKGEKQAEQLSVFLAPYGITRIIASPYQRAQQSIAPFAAAHGINVETDPRLVERVLAAEQLPNWLEALERSFEEVHIRYPGGETSHEAMRRSTAVAAEVLRGQDDQVALVTHGNLLGLMLRAFDASVGFETWKSLTNPDVFLLQHDGRQVAVRRIWTATP